MQKCFQRFEYVRVEVTESCVSSLSQSKSRVVLRCKQRMNSRFSFNLLLRLLLLVGSYTLNELVDTLHLREGTYRVKAYILKHAPIRSMRNDEINDLEASLSERPSIAGVLGMCGR